MTISSFALIVTIICSMLWGIFDGIRKYLSSRVKLTITLFYLCLGFSLFFYIAAYLKGIPEFNPDYLLPGAITVLSNAAANFYYIKAMSIAPISNSVPFLAFTTLFTALTGFIFLNESLSLIQIFGIVILVAASLVVNGKLKNSGSLKIELLNLWDSFLCEKSSHYMIFVSLLWAISAPFDKLAVQAMNVETHGFLQSISITLIYLFYLFIKKELRYLKDAARVPRSLILGSVVSCFALGLQFYAYQLMKVSIFESMKRAFALFTAIIISILFFKEKISKLKIIGILLIVFSSILILNG